MFRNLIRRKQHPASGSPEGGVPIEQEPITRGFVVKMVLIVAFGGPAIATLIAPFVDQAIRNKVNVWMSAPDLFTSISIAPAEFTELPPHWRQALADIALRSKDEAVDVQNVVGGLKMSDITLVNLLAPYATSFGILRDNDQLSEHPMPELSYSDFSHLQDLGILEDINNGRKINPDDEWNPDAESILTGTTVYLAFKPKARELRAALEVTAFTSGGKQLIDALQVPSNLSYFEWFAKKLEGKGFAVELYAIGINQNDMSVQVKIQGRIDRQSIQPWPP